MTTLSSTINIAIAQISPIWLDKKKTIEKISNYILQAGKKKTDLIVFGEGLLPGYPFWLSLTEGSVFDSIVQKEIHAHYLRNAICIESGELNEICDLAAKYKIAIYLGIIERPRDRGGHSVYCSLVYIDQNGITQSVHRKLQPTYEERLTWAQGDGHGLRVHDLKAFRVGGLNCWENWMPLARVSLYGQGENLHIAVWPGSDRNTVDITRFIAKESRSFVVSASSLMRKDDFPKDTPHYDIIVAKAPETLANGGSCIAGPDGNWVIEPTINEECLITAQIDLNRVLEERQNFDPSGHYSRPDVTQLHVNRERLGVVKLKNGQH